MDTKEFSLLLSSWLRLPQAETAAALRSMREAGGLPGADEALTPDQAAAGAVGLMLTMLDGGSRGDGERCRAMAAMVLEGERGTDPLDAMDRPSFNMLVGASLGPRSINGYKNFAETIGAAMSKHRTNVGTVELDRVTLRFDGAEPVGIVEARVAYGAVHAFRFTPGGMPSPGGGMLREASIGRGALAGLSFVLDGDSVTRPVRVGKVTRSGVKAARRQAARPA